MTCQVAAEAAGDPGRVAALTRHPRVGVRELTGLAVLGNGGAPDGTVAAERLGEAGFRTALGVGPCPRRGGGARVRPPPPPPPPGLWVPPTPGSRPPPPPG